MTTRTDSAHIIWDWNGTLLRDVDVALAATNACFREIGLPALTLERYRDLYCVPIPRFYERLLGRAPSQAEWSVLNDTFQRHYFALEETALLTEGGAELLASWASGGHTQSLCSLASHDRLHSWVSRFGIRAHFVRVDGSRDGQGPSRGKTAQMAEHLREMSTVDPARTVVIGDAVDDAHAAAAAGVRAVLYTGGSQSRRTLESAGVPDVPVVDSLAEAVERAAELVG